MTIRRQLATFFILTIAFVTAMGGAMYAGRPIIEGAFRQSLAAMNSLNAIRDLRSHLNTQRLAVSRYLLVDDAKELINFEESSRNSHSSMQTLKTQFEKSPPDWLISLDQLFQETETLASRVVNDYKKGHLITAREDYLVKLTPKLKVLNERVNALEQEKASEASMTFQRVQSLLNRTGTVLLIVFVIVIFIGLIYSRTIYRAIMIPLEVLRKGTEAFGKGHWDHIINLPSTNEFGTLAKSFNTMAENVKQLQMQAVHLDRMSAVGQLAGGVAHEINNPLTAVLGQSQILLAKLPETDESVPALKKIENAALRCKKIVRGLLDFSRPTQTSLDQIDMNEVVRATLDLCEADLKKAKVNVDRKYASLLPKIQANSSELQQVLLNLFNNAIQAMPKGGNLQVETRTHKNPLKMMDRRKGAPARVVDGPWVEVRVADTGIGISAEHINKIFEPFFTTKEIGQGTGLGLAVSMGIVQKHGGDLRVESDGINRGAAFYLTLPLKPPQGIPSIAIPRSGGKGGT